MHYVKGSFGIPKRLSAERPSHGLKDRVFSLPPEEAWHLAVMHHRRQREQQLEGSRSPLDSDIASSLIAQLEITRHARTPGRQNLNRHGPRVGRAP